MHRSALDTGAVSHALSDSIFNILYCFGLHVRLSGKKHKGEVRCESVHFLNMALKYPFWLQYDWLGCKVTLLGNSHAALITFTEVEQRKWLRGMM